MADSIESSHLATYVMDLISAGGTVTLMEREPRADEIGRRPFESQALILRVMRDRHSYGFWERDLRIQAEDKLIVIGAPAHPLTKDSSSNASCIREPRRIYSLVETEERMCRASTLGLHETPRVRPFSDPGCCRASDPEVCAGAGPLRAHCRYSRSDCRWQRRQRCAVPKFVSLRKH